MRSATIFTESQKFTQWWLWPFLGSLLVLFFYLDYKQLIKGSPVGNHPASDLGLLLFSLIPFLFFIFFLVASLRTKVGTEGIEYQYYPIQQSYRFIPWQEVERAEVRKYRPIPEFLGWGIRWNRRTKTKAYTVKGNWGMDIKLTNGKRILIGTQDPQGIREALEKSQKSKQGYD